MRMRSATLRPGRGKPVDQSVQPLPFRSQVPFILHHKILHRRRISGHGFIVPKRHRLHDPPNDPPQQQPRRNPVPYRPLQTRRAVRHCLRRIHLAPLPLAIRPQPRDPFLHFFHPSRFKEIFHAERPPPVNHSQPSGCRPLPSGNGPYDEKGLFPRCDCVGKRSVRRLEGIVFLAGEETQERTALLRDVVADRAAQHWILGLEGVEDRALRDRTLDAELHLAAHVRQRPQMSGEYDSNHGNVWTSTESTAGRSRTMGDQLSPALAAAYTWPPVVPKYTPHVSSASTAMASRRTFTEQPCCG